MKRLSLPLVVLVLLLSAGCETITYDALLYDGVASMNSGNVPASYTVVGKFQYSTRASFTAFDLITLKDPAIIDEMKKAVQVNDGDAVINLSIVEVTDIVDILINVFVSTVTTAAFKSSIDVYSTKSVEITGDVVKYRSGALRFPSGGRPEQTAHAMLKP